MDVYGRMLKIPAVLVLLLFSVSSNAGLIFGAAARAQFEGYQATLGDSLQTFDGLAAQTDLRTQLPGLEFKTTFKRFVGPPAAINLPVHVVCDGGNPYGSFCSDTDNIIAGTGTNGGGEPNGGATDGQSRYEVAFDTPVLRAGLDRFGAADYTLTRFFSGAALLGEHINTAGAEFVGFLSDATNPITRIEMDAVVGCAANVYCVLYSDNLFYGTRAIPTGPGVIPVPATLALFGLGLAGLGWSRRKTV